MLASRSNNTSSKKRIRLILLLIFVFLVWAIITMFTQWSDIKETKNELIKLQAEEQKALENKEVHEKEALMLKNYDYIAEIARKYYFLSKPGEIIIILPEE